MTFLRRLIMINLIVNEYKKIKASKIIISACLVIISIYILIYLNRDMNGTELFNLIYSFIPFLGILICAIFAGIVNNEVNKGTFRYYLTKPYYRSKIIISKLIFVYLYIVFIYIVTIVSFVVFVNIFSSFVFDVNMFWLVFKHFIPIFFMGTLCVLLSTFINSLALCTSILFLICLLSTLISQLLFSVGLNIIEYTFLPYVDFSLFVNNDFVDSMRENYGVVVSMSKGSVILVFHIVLFAFLMINFFTKKDIKY